MKISKRNQIEIINQTKEILEKYKIDTSFYEFKIVGMNRKMSQIDWREHLILVDDISKEDSEDFNIECYIHENLMIELTSLSFDKQFNIIEWNLIIH